MIEEIDAYLAAKGKPLPQTAEVYHLQAVQTYLTHLNRGFKKTKASLETALGLRKGISFSSRIRVWADQW